MGISLQKFKTLNLVVSFVMLVSFLVISTSFHASAMPPRKDKEVDEDLILNVHNVGQGNLVTLRFPNKEVMIVDAGSKGYEEPLAYQAALLDLQSRTSQKKIRERHDLPPQSPPATQIISAQLTPQSTTHPSDFSPLARFAQANKLSFTQDMFIENFRRELPKNGKGIRVKTVVISHPDVDHYNWLRHIFSHEEDKLEYLILGGLPNHYINKEFILWLRKLPKFGTKVICPAVEHGNLNAGKEIDELFSKDKKDYIFKPFYSTPLEDSYENNKKLFQDAFDFGEDIYIRLLSVNPLHVEQMAINGDKSKQIARLNDPSDDNPDSIVLRISCVDKPSLKDIYALTILGDATEQTYQRILSVYHGNYEALKSRAVVASHHGASSHGAANTTFIKALSSEIVLISCGHHRKFTHPKLEAYIAFKDAENLVRFKLPHSILINEPIKKRPLDLTDKEDANPPKKRQIKTSNKGHNSNNSPSNSIYRIHRTYYGIFSTLSSGTLKVTFSSDKLMQLIKGIGPNNQEEILPRSTQVEEDKVDIIGKKRKSELDKGAKESINYQKKINEDQEKAKNATLRSSSRPTPTSPTRPRADQSQVVLQSSTSSSSSSTKNKILRTRKK